MSESKKNHFKKHKKHYKAAGSLGTIAAIITPITVMVTNLSNKEEKLESLARPSIDMYNDISTNKEKSQKNSDDISDISKKTDSIPTNKANISRNSDGISRNSNDISVINKKTDLISTSISTNTANITRNSDDIFDIKKRAHDDFTVTNQRLLNIIDSVGQLKSSISALQAQVSILLRRT